MGQGRTERSRKYSSVRRKRIRTSTVVRGKGEGGGGGGVVGDIETGTARIEERTLESKTARFPRRRMPTRRGTPDHRGGRRLLHPSAHTQAKYHQPHRSVGGVQTCIGMLDRKPGEDIGWPSAGWLQYFQRTDDEGPDAAGGGRLNTRIWTERRQKEQKERGDG